MDKNFPLTQESVQNLWIAVSDPVRFAKRIPGEQNANPFHLKCSELRRNGTRLLDLTVSNPTECGFGYLNPDLLTPLQNLDNLIYSPDPRGLLSCRKAISDYYAAKGIHVETDQIFVTTNTSEAYSFVFKLLLNPGDAVLAPEPSYPLLDYLAVFNDVQTVRKSDAQKIKAALLVHPNNPTGNYVSLEERKNFNDLARKNGWSLIVDEVFLDYPLKNNSLKKQSFAGNQDVLTLTLSGISKVLGLPQMKLSWIVVNGPEKEKHEALNRLEILADTYLSASTPIQNALTEWMKKIELIQEEIRSRIQKNYETLLNESKKNLSVYVPE